mmetsp:Transcript_42882/g.130477  ORF Transcript_42882/g.130477 Transcript_42882/m.130477 type:complete len:203 (+) Transcript_42882:1764-2372(+)
MHILNDRRSGAAPSVPESLSRSIWANAASAWEAEYRRPRQRASCFNTQLNRTVSGRKSSSPVSRKRSRQFWRRSRTLSVVSLLVLPPLPPPVPPAPPPPPSAMQFMTAENVILLGFISSSPFRYAVSILSNNSSALLADDAPGAPLLVRALMTALYVIRSGFTLLSPSRSYRLVISSNRAHASDADFRPRRRCWAYNFNTEL